MAVLLATICWRCCRFVKTNSRVALQHPSAVTNLPLQSFLLFVGCCGSHCVRHFFKKYNCRTTFGRASHSGLKTSGLALDFSTVPFRPWRGITFVMKIYWNVSRTLTCTIVISKRNRQCQNHNGNP